MIDRRLAAEIVTRHSIPKKEAAAIVRYVLAAVVDDLRECEQALRDPDMALGVRIAAGRLEWAGERVRSQ